MNLHIEKEQIEKRASDLLTEINCDAFAYVDVVKLSEKIGFVIGNADLDDSEDGFIIVNPIEEIPYVKSNKVIGVNSKRSIEDKRFIIAHELGHYLLHYNESDRSIFAKRENIRGKSETENEADYFAACLLMPAAAFTREFQKSSASSFAPKVIEETLSALFVVPRESVSRRMVELSLV